MGRKEGGCCAPFARELGPRLIGPTKMWRGRGLLPTKCRLHPSSGLAKIEINRKLGAVPPFKKLRAYLTQRRLGQGLPLYQVASGILIHPAVWP